MRRMYGLVVPPGASYGALVVYAPARPVYDWEGLTVAAYPLNEMGSLGQPRYALIKQPPRGVFNLPAVFNLRDIPGSLETVRAIGWMGTFALLGVPVLGVDQNRPNVALFDHVPPGDYELVLGGPVHKHARSGVKPGHISQVRFLG